MQHNIALHTIEIDSLSKSYGNKQVFSNAYLKIKTGDVCALFGGNGCGKSTLQGVIFGSIKADFKSVRADDKFVKTPFLQADLISYLPDNQFVPSNMKVSEALDLYNISRDVIDDIIFELARKPICELSSGECKYVEAFLILHKKSYFTLLDEPFKFLFPSMIGNIQRLIQTKSKEKGIVIADHDYESVLDIANRILLIEDESIYELKGEEDLKNKGYI